MFFYVEKIFYGFRQFKSKFVDQKIAVKYRDKTPLNIKFSQMLFGAVVYISYSFWREMDKGLI